ncbi:MAG: hypothetical protein SXA11_08470 [Cyanobacteriota bacterium]|nr:hypothetical protein [Cyanobacteriota bacterium]
MTNCLQQITNYESLSWTKIMTNGVTNSDFFESCQIRTELDILEAIALEDTAYPWNPEDPESEAYFSKLENEFAESDFMANIDIVNGSQKLFAKLEEKWSEFGVNNSAFEKFARRMPEEILSKLTSSIRGLGERANQTMGGLSLSDRLVYCVAEILPRWNIEDLEVLARPMAYAMRDSGVDPVESALANIPEVDWQDLSEIERARLSLAIALFTISETEE